MNILYIDNDPAQVEATSRSLRLRELEFNLQIVSDIQKAFSLLSTTEFDVILCNSLLTDGTGLDLIKQARERGILTAVVLITNHDDIKSAAEALEAGAADIVLAQTDIFPRLPFILQNACSVTRYEKQKSALRESETRYRNIFENATEGIFQSSVDGKFIRVNPAMARIYGYDSPEDMVSSTKNNYEGFYANSETRLRFLEEISSKGSVVKFNAPNIRKDGSFIWTSVNAHAVRNEAGEISYYEGFLSDITVQKQAELDREASDDTYKSFVEQFEGVVFFVDFQDERISRYISPRLKDLLGYTPEEWAGGGKFWENGLHPDDRERVLTENNRTNQTGQPFHVEYRFRKKDGCYIWLREDAYLVRNQAGDPSYWHGIMFDITPQKKAQEAILAGEGSYRGLFNSVSQAIYIQDDQGRFLDVNDGALRMYGYPREFFIGKTPEVLSAPGKNDLADLVKKTNLAAMGQTQEFEFWGRRKNGQIFPKTVSLMKGTYFGQDVIIAFGQDITEQKKAKEFLDRQLRELTILHAASVAGAQSNSEDEIISRVTQITSGIFTEVCGILMLNKSEDALTPHFSCIGPAVDNWRREFPITEGISGTAITSGRTIRVGDITKIQNYIKAAPGINSELCAPFRVLGKIIGVFDVESKRENAFDGQDERLLNTIAAGLGTAIEKLRLFKAEQAQRQREAAILNLMRAAASSLDLNQVLQSILEQLTNIIPSDAGTIQLLDTDKLNISAAFGNEAVNFAKSETLTLSNYPLNATVINQKKTIKIDDTWLDDRFKRYNQNSKTRSFLAIPLIANDRAIGMLTLDSYLPARFSEQDEELGLVIANHASIAIENARLFKTEQHRRNQAEILRKATEALTSSIELEKLFEIIFDSLAELVPYDSASIETLNQGVYEIIAGRGIAQNLIGRKYTTDFQSWGGIEAFHQPIIIADVQDDDRFKKLSGSEYIHAWMGVPLLSQGRLIGLLNFDSRQPDTFTQEHAYIAQIFANQAAAAIENARLFREENRRSQIIEALAAVSNEIAATRDITPSLDKIAERSLALLNASAVAFYLLQEDNKTIKVVSAKGAYQTELLSVSIQLGEGITGRIIAAGVPEIVDDIPHDPRTVSIPGVPDDDALFDTMISAPLLLHGISIGAINAWRLKSKGLFDHSELNFLISIAHQAAISIETVRLFQETTRRAQEATAIAEIGRDISSTLKIDLVLERITSYAQNLLRAITSAVYILEPDQSVLRAIYAVGIDATQIMSDPLEIGVGILGSIAKQKYGEIVNESMKDPRALTIIGTVDDPDEHLIGVPIVANSNLTGLLVAWRSGLEDKFQPEDLHFLTSLAQQASVAIENARQFEEEQTRRRIAENLRTAATAVTSSRDPHQVLETILIALRQVVPFDQGTMTLLEDERVKIVVAQGYPHDHAMLNQTYPSSNPLLMELKNSQRPLILDDALNDKRYERWAGADLIRGWLGIPLVVHGDVIGFITLGSFKVAAFDQNAADLALLFSLHASAAIDHTQLFVNLQKTNQDLIQAYDTTLAGWAKALELRDKETHGHTNRVTELTVDLARFMGIPKADLVHLRRGALLHDIGKVGVPNEILHKEGPLTDEEWVEMRKHPRYAFDMLYPISFLRPALDIPYSHHEWWDGTGYPQKLKGEDIPLPARMFAVVDVWDALLSDRPYRKAWKREDVKKYLREQTGTHFDPEIVETFLKMIEAKDLQEMQKTQPIKRVERKKNKK